MAQQLSVEDAFPIFRERCRELADENLILRAQVAVLERQVAELRAEKEQLNSVSTEPAAAAPGGPYEPSQPYTDVDVTE